MSSCAALWELPFFGGELKRLHMDDLNMGQGQKLWTESKPPPRVIRLICQWLALLHFRVQNQTG